jgi:hypothetical protein
VKTYIALLRAINVAGHAVIRSPGPERAPGLPVMPEKEAMEAMAIQGLNVFMVSRPTKKGSYGFPNAFIVAFARTSEL